MSHFTLGHKGVAAVENKKWEEGVRLLTDALKGAQSPAWLLARAQAYQQTSKLDRALADAERAYLVASERQQASSRDQMIMAQYRRAVILFKMGRFADADACCLWSMQLAQGKNFRKDEDTVATNVDKDGFYAATLEAAKDASQMPKTDSGAAALSPAKTTVAEWTRAYVWRSQALAALEKLPPGDPRRKLTVLRVPEAPVLSAGTDEAEEAPQDSHRVGDQNALATAPRSQAPPPAKRPDESLKVDFYQTLQSVNMTIFIAGVDKSQLTVHFDDQKVTLTNVVVGDFKLPPTALQLEGAINPAACKYSVTAKKIEVTLAKSDPVKWSTWGQQVKHSNAHGPKQVESAAAPSSTKTVTTAPPEAEPVESKPEPETKGDDPLPGKKPARVPAYPTSSKSGPKDWDNIAAAEDEDDGKDVNQFFKQLYANSTPEQQRAMMKSFTESNGTALSTDWNDVKGRTVETHPPDGVEAKKW